jgi:conjugal transfer pilus assembly protein TraV
MNKKIIIISVTCASFLSGCGLLPYHDDDACALEGNYGKCINGEQAYEEAIEGRELFGNYIGEEGLTDEMPGTITPSVSQQGEMATSQMNADGYMTLKGRTYDKLSGLVDKPNAPMLVPPKVISTLVLNYQSSSNEQHMYMPRYIYTIAKQPEFLLNQYLFKKEDNSMNILNMME